MIFTALIGICVGIGSGLMFESYRHDLMKRRRHRAILYREDNAYYIQIVRGPMSGLKADLYPSDMRFDSPDIGSGK